MNDDQVMHDDDGNNIIPPIIDEIDLGDPVVEDPDALEPLSDEDDQELDGLDLDGYGDEL